MQIPIVNEQDEIIGYKDRKDRNLVDITRVSALWITNEDGEILLAQRGLNKTHSPGLWGPAVAGTVEEGETYESNIIKEAEEEIGLVAREGEVEDVRWFDKDELKILLKEKPEMFVVNFENTTKDFLA